MAPDQLLSVQEDGLFGRPDEQALARGHLRDLKAGALERIPDVADHDLRTFRVRHAGNRSTASVPFGAGGRMRDMNSLWDWSTGHAASRPWLLRDRRLLRDQWLVRGQRLRRSKAGAW